MDQRNGTNSSATGQVPQTAANQLHVLVVEDHQDTARMMQRLLNACGHDVRTADTVASALAIAQQESVDVLVSDIGLPDGTGLDLMRQLVASDRRIPGIVLSGYDLAEDIASSRAAGFVEHMSKPIDVQRLDAAIRRLAAGPKQ